MKLQILLLGFCLFASACATNQKSRLAATAIGIGVGAGIGAGTSPEDERPELHALYWGGIVGVVTAVAANYYFNDERDIEVMKLENEKMKAQLDFFQSGTATLVKQGKGKADKRFFQSGKAQIKLYEIDQWVDDGPNRKYHRDMMMETVPLENKDK